MAILAVVLIAVPLLSAGRARATRSEHALEIYRDQMDEVGRDEERGLISADQAEAARAEIGRRILALESGHSPEREQQTSRAPAIAMVVAVAVPVLAGAIYLSDGRPELPGLPAAERQAERNAVPDDAALRTRVAALARTLEADPSRLPDWLALGDTLTALREHAKAAIAYRQAARLAPHSADFAAREAEALTFAADGQVTPDARRAFEEALRRNKDEPRALYYLGLADRQAGRLRPALDRWLALEAGSPPDAPWLGFLRPRIANLADELNLDDDALAALRRAAAAELPETSAPPGPTREQVEAAQEMSAEDRSAMIRSMVDRLASRLGENPGDAEGWTRLGRARTVLGELDAAKAAYGKAAALRPDDVAALGAYADSIVAAAEPNAPDPAELKPVVDRILALDDSNPRALWLAGALAASADDPATARRHWTRLLDALDPNGVQYAELKKQIDALPQP